MKTWGQVYLLTLLVGLSSCGLSSETRNIGAAGLTCQDASGKAVNVGSIFGKWKKTKGYNPERKANELALNYDVIMFEYGTPVCMVEINNGAARRTVFRGTYEHDVSNKKLTINYTQGEGSGGLDKASYSISGDCEKPILKIDYESATLADETYELFSKDIEAGTCNPSS